MARLSIALVECPINDKRLASDQERQRKAQLSEAKAIKARLKPAQLGAPPLYTWPLWHKPRKREAYTGPVGPIRDWRYEGETPAYLRMDADFRAGRDCGGDGHTAGCCMRPCCDVKIGQPRWLLGPGDRPPPGRPPWNRGPGRPRPAAAAVASSPPSAAPTAGQPGRKRVSDMALALRNDQPPMQTPPRTPGRLAQPATPAPAAPALTIEEELAALRAENARLKASRRGPLSCKVSEKGAVSVYGLGRFPVTLYKEQMLRLLDAEAQVRTFIADHADELSVKVLA